MLLSDPIISQKGKGRTQLSLYLVAMSKDNY